MYKTGEEVLLYASDEIDERCKKLKNLQTL